ncbi:MAG: hypothetical protein DRO90_00335 [Candidatus Altiarchaeales archaeon]|nr:MAG: hypothetical protein DRO95_03530 [Candidatus Altiarchaeales archaeon]RLI95169.1 MAG: hypothetical protein DRO94_01115 [Candidatus Altiarchaeales archaeon]RLI95439.1 MAG: hypothetical protein DRO90_00335 [Candidatus Altiarchaeales archaeon]HDO82116.1 hypothetical protein [Candidatus Altiarchaeales archaeon]HEX54765.1 hypothetical protein [Candidatus Altiarchaeales archaeon]
MEKQRDKTVKMAIPSKGICDVNELLRQIFWREPEMVRHAREFLDYVKEWGRTESPYRVEEWKNYCIRRGITQSQYHNMLKRLRMSGMIEKVYNKNKGTHEIHISRKFSDIVFSMFRVWENYTNN